LICAKNDEIRRLENLAALRIDVGDTCGALTLCIEIDRTTFDWVRNSKFCFFSSAGRMVVCGEALAYI